MRHSLEKKGQITNTPQLNHRSSLLLATEGSMVDEQPEYHLFNGIYNRLYAIQLSGTNHLLEAAKESFRTKPDEIYFKLEHI